MTGGCLVDWRASRFGGASARSNFHITYSLETREQLVLVAWPSQIVIQSDIRGSGQVVITYSRSIDGRDQWFEGASARSKFHYCVEWSATAWNGDICRGGGSGDIEVPYVGDSFTQVTCRRVCHAFRPVEMQAR